MDVDEHEIERVMLEAAATRRVAHSDELLVAVADQLGLDLDDPAVRHELEIVEESLIDDVGPLALLDDRVVHVGSVFDGIVLTHVINEAELETEFLNVSVDLAGFMHAEEVRWNGEVLDDVSVDRGHLAWVGEQGWLSGFASGDVVAVRVSPEGVATMERLDEVPPVDPTLVSSVRAAYDREVKEAYLPVSSRDVLLSMMVDGGVDAFTEPQAPLCDLYEAAGLELDGADLAHDRSVWANARQARRIYRLLDLAGEDRSPVEPALAALAVIDDLGEEVEVDGGDLAAALRHLADVDVLWLVLEDLDEHPFGDLAVAARSLLAVARTGPQRCATRVVAALAAQHAGDWVAAEQHLELAVEADPSNPVACDRLAWYVSDRGDAVRARRLWQRCVGVFDVAAVIDALDEFGGTAAAATLGRNEPCWCGSGRKFKHCHLGVDAPAPLAERVGWLCRKAAMYVDRSSPFAREAVLEVAYARVGDGRIAEAFQDPIVIDLVLVEGGWFERFLRDRGHLLPDDEAMLAQAWALVPRTVYEIVAADPGASVTVQDLRTAERTEVRERTFSRTAAVGTTICARAVPDGTTHQFVGGLFPVRPGDEARVLDMLDRGDPVEIATWVEALHRPPELRNRENEPLMMCQVDATCDDVARLVAHLDATYDVDEPGRRWTERFELNEDEAVMRAAFTLDGDVLRVEANSEARIERVLDRLTAIPGVRVLSDERSTPAEAVENGRDPVEPSPVDPDVVNQVLDMMERRWCDEPVPALHGQTPREAAADPVGREQLARLLASYDAHQPPEGGFAMRPDRLRALLGL